MKKYILLILIMTLIVSFLLGLYLYRLGKTNDKIAFQVEYTKSNQEQKIEDIKNDIEETSISDNVITPNTKIIEKRYYNECEHLVTTEKKAKQSLVNKNESELQVEYIGWEIQRFTPEEVVVYKEINDFCDEHYLVKDINGEIIIYKLDKHDKIKEVIRETGIETKYLPTEDIEKLEEGIKVNGDISLNCLIEDYE